MIRRAIARIPRPWFLGGVGALVIVAVVTAIVVSLSSDGTSSTPSSSAGSKHAANGSSATGDGAGDSGDAGGSGGSGGSGDGNPATGSTLPDVVPVWTVQVSLQGSFAFTDSFTARGASDINGVITCADIAAHGTRTDTFTVPNLPTNTKMAGGHSLGGSISVLTYKGVGAYTDNDFAHTDNLIVDREGDDISTNRFLAPDSGSPGTLTVKTDGGGAFSFTDWQSPSSGGRISGSIVWTCLDTKP